MQTSPLGRHYPPLFLFCFLGKRCSALGNGTGTPVCSVKPMADISLCLIGMGCETWAMGRLNSGRCASLEDTTTASCEGKTQGGRRRKMRPWLCFYFVHTCANTTCLSQQCPCIQISCRGGMALFLAKPGRCELLRRLDLRVSTWRVCCQACLCTPVPARSRP